MEATSPSLEWVVVTLAMLNQLMSFLKCFLMGVLVGLKCPKTVSISMLFGIQAMTDMDQSSVVAATFSKRMLGYLMLRCVLRIVRCARWSHAENTSI